MTGTSADSVCFFRPRLIPGIELVSVCYSERSFPEHSHSEYVIGAVVAGAETLTVAGRSHHVNTGSVLQLHPGEVHANATSGPEALRYDVLYIRRDAFRPFLGPDCHDADFQFQAPMSVDPTLFDTVSATHAVLRRDATGRLEQESALGALARALAATSPCVVESAGSHGACLRRIADAKAYIEANFADGFGLQDLARLSGLSVFHFTRSFKKMVGLSPLAYRNQCRVIEARIRLLDGQPIAHVALEVGYADQSHLTRQFQRIVGATPHRYTQQ